MAMEGPPLSQRIVPSKLPLTEDVQFLFVDGTMYLTILYKQWLSHHIMLSDLIFDDGKVIERHP